MPGATPDSPAPGAQEPPAETRTTGELNADARQPAAEAASGPVPRQLGLVFGSEEGNWYANAWLRAQVRWSDPFDDDPQGVAEVDDPPGADLALNRARLKAEGHLGRPWLGFYFEHELSGDHPLLDLRLDIAIRENLELRVGQYKVLYNRERVDSSGRQQFIERSVANEAFTLDRQRGVTLAQHVAGGTAMDSWLMAGVFAGDGRDPGQQGDEPLWMARWQWHFLGRKLGYSQGDLAFLAEPAATFSLAAARVRGPYTRFSSAGGGQLHGFEQGGNERYTLEQWQQGFAWHHRGWSVQQELHFKRVEDHEAGQRSRLAGGYAQLGKAWPLAFRGRPRAVELALRHGRVDWRDTVPERTQVEWTLAANLYLDGHDNKLNADASRLSVDERGGPQADDFRLRLQWDVSF